MRGSRFTLYWGWSFVAFWLPLFVDTKISAWSWMRHPQTVLVTFGPKSSQWKELLRIQAWLVTQNPGDYFPPESAAELRGWVTWFHHWRDFWFWEICFPIKRMLLGWMRMDFDTVTFWILWVGSRFVVEKKHLQGTSKSQIKRGIFVGFSAGFAGTMLAPLRYTVWSNSISPTGAGSFKYLSVGRFWCETMMTILACHFLLLQCDYVLPLTLMIFLWTSGQPSLSVPNSIVNISDVSKYFLPYKSFPWIDAEL